MSRSDWFAVIALVISIAALLVSWRTARSQQRATEIEEARRREEVEARQSATVQLDLEREPGERATRFWVAVHNVGLASAREVDVELHPAPGKRPWKVIGTDLPISSLAPGRRSGSTCRCR